MASPRRAAVEEARPCPERGWLLLYRHRRVEEPFEGERAAAEALEVAREFGDTDLEVYALSQLGLALVTQGRPDEGFARLDEAMAAATGGEVRSFRAIGDTCRNMLIACERAVELDRAAQWLRVTDEFTRRRNFVPLFAYCRVIRAGLLGATGRWSEAERELKEAVRIYEGGHRGMRLAALVRLAELRLWQGRLEEAEHLLAGSLDDPAALRPAAAIRLARGEPVVATAMLRRRLDRQADTLLSAPLLGLLVEAETAAGNLDGARAAAERLWAVAEGSGRPAVAAAARVALGRVGLAGQEPGAVAGLETALELFTELGMPHDAARTRLEIARGPGPLSQREAEVLALVGEGLTNAEIAARLFISPKTVEHHVGRILAKIGARTRAEADGTFDAVTGTNSFQYAADPVRALQET